MEIIIIGVEPACPRCKKVHEMAEGLSRKLGGCSVRKITWDSEEAQKYGRVTTGHHIAQEYGVEVKWEELKDLVSGEWTPKLDEVLMPLKRKADEVGILMTPVVLIDGKVAFMGYVPSETELKEKIRKAL
ncbi:MAG: thioredoxin family protein [Proteobacteria bacterium]|nr:thioredoxin family protein [Pseudomonadota bacterium]